MRERDIKSQGQKLAQVKLERQMDPEGHDSEVDESNPLHAVVAARWIQGDLKLPLNSTPQILLPKILVPFDQRNNINTNK